MKIEGFTPAPDFLIEKYGLLTAAVYGKYWRYWRAYGMCSASQDRIAKELSISVRTLYNHTKTLVEKGYLKDLDEGQQGKPHRFIPTNKLSIDTVVKVSHVEASELDSELNGKDRNQIPNSPELDSDKDSNSFKDTSAENGAVCWTCDEPSEIGNDLWVESENRFVERCGACGILDIKKKKTKTKPKKRTDEERRQAVIDAIATGAKRAAENPFPELLEYPPDVQGILGVFCGLTKINPPKMKSGKNSQAAFWIASARELNSAGGERVLRDYWPIYEAELDRNGGTPHFAVDSPRSLVNKLRGHQGLLAREMQTNQKASGMPVGKL